MSADGFRNFPGRVALIGLLRVAHVAGVVGVGATVLAGHAATAAGAFLAALVASGLAIALLDAYANRAYFRQVSGLAVLAKAALVAALGLTALFGAWAFWSLLCFSVLLAHAPGRIRHRRLR